MNLLTELAIKYKTDKCPQIKHAYTPHYYRLLNDKRLSIKKVFEFGIGHPSQMSHVKDYIVGASLYMWRDFFPNAMIYGADNLPEAIFQDERIKTYLCDERDETQVKELVSKIGSDIDLVIDDASHAWWDQANLVKYMMPLLKKDVIYIIEDVGMPSHVANDLPGYKCTVARIPESVVKKNKIPKDRLLQVENI